MNLAHLKASTWIHHIGSCGNMQCKFVRPPFLFWKDSFKHIFCLYKPRGHRAQRTFFPIECHAQHWQSLVPHVTPIYAKRWIPTVSQNGTGTVSGIGDRGRRDEGARLGAPVRRRAGRRNAPHDDNDEEEGAYYRKLLSFFR